MIRLYTDIPNVAFHKIVRQYAFELGRPVFTMKEQQSALINYIFFAVGRN
ncbi:MAG TPA: hypothetical protein VGN00_09385 [Puia sp.]|jgi:hypothetical protein